MDSNVPSDLHLGSGPARVRQGTFLCGREPALFGGSEIGDAFGRAPTASAGRAPFDGVVDGLLAELGAAPDPAFAPNALPFAPLPGLAVLASPAVELVTGAAFEPVLAAPEPGDTGAAAPFAVLALPVAAALSVAAALPSAPPSTGAAPAGSLGAASARDSILIGSTGGTGDGLRSSNTTSNAFASTTPATTIHSTRRSASR